MMILDKDSKMPRSGATYEEYEKFLACFYQTYLRFEDSHRDSCERLRTVLNGLAKRQGVKIPAEVLWGKDPIDQKAVFASSDEAEHALLKFYNHYKVTMWNDADKDDVEELTAIIMCSSLRF